MSVILICSCFNMKKKAAEAFSLLFPDVVLPEIIKGKDSIFKFSQSVQNKHIEAISKLSGRFAYYVELDGDTITKEVDLMTSKRIR